MVCNKCGAVCDDYSTVCSTCGSPLSEAFELVKTPEQLQKENTGKILGIISIVCAPVAFLTWLIGSFCCMSWMGYIVHAAGIILGVIGAIMGGDNKKLGIIGVIINVAMVVIPIILFVVLYLLMIMGILSMDAMYY